MAIAHTFSSSPTKKRSLIGGSVYMVWIRMRRRLPLLESNEAHAIRVVLLGWHPLRQEPVSKRVCCWAKEGTLRLPFPKLRKEHLSFSVASKSLFVEWSQQNWMSAFVSDDNMHQQIVFQMAETTCENRDSETFLCMHSRREACVHTLALRAQNVVHVLSRVE